MTDALTKWRDTPKVELHVHLEGAAPPAFVKKMGAEQGIDLTGLFDENGAYASNDFTSFLKAYETMSKVFVHPESYRALTEAVLAEQASQGVIYTEIFLSPTSLGYDEAEWDVMLAAIEEGAAAAEARHGIVCRFIPVIIRHHGPEKALEGVKVMLRANRGRMRGFGMAGDERRNRVADFVRPFEMMAEAGFRLTAHAGEFGGAESVRDALDLLHVERIGHGVRAIEDPALVERLAAEEITLEVCPGSNVALGVYPDITAHPIARLRDAGCAVTVSTDDPPFFHTTMDAEYAALHGAFGFRASDFRAMNETAIASAFCEDELKADLSARLRADDASA